MSHASEDKVTVARPLAEALRARDVQVWLDEFEMIAVTAFVAWWQETRAVHVVAARNEEDDETIVFTVYEPDPKKWESDSRGEETYEMRDL